MNRTASVLLGAVALAASFSATFAKSGLAVSSSGNTPHLFIHASKYRVLYDQSGGDDGSVIVSQNFESDFDIYDSQAADDFTVPAGQKWTIQEVDVAGAYFNGPGQGPAVSENVYFYKDAKGLPGKLLKKGSFTVNGADDGFGNFAIDLGKKGIKLGPGKYWVSVQVNMDSTSGEWGWALRTPIAGSEAVWQNPGDGFGTGCVTWASDCLAAPGHHPSGGADQDMTLKGKTKT